MSKDYFMAVLDLLICLLVIGQFQFSFYIFSVLSISRTLG